MQFSNKLPKVNNRPIGGHSPNLVTLEPNDTRLHALYGKSPHPYFFKIVPIF
jgi:hypothetical protein